MPVKITIVIPNRDRELKTVKRTLASLAPQLGNDAEAVVVDYGSGTAYQKQLQSLIKEFEHIALICCSTQGQLWQKSRAINIALKNCESDFFMVADMDMLFHPQAIKKILEIVDTEQVVYFKVGILEEESKREKAFEQYAVKFYTGKEATGITAFPTEILKAIHGFDEFYHGWGAEDTDVHVRLEHTGITVHFYDEEALFLHQWHPKHYRSPMSIAPFHQILEQINHKYIMFSRKLKHIKANTTQEWGLLPDDNDYSALLYPDITLECPATEEAVKALLFQWELCENKVVAFQIEKDPREHDFKTILKKQLGKRVPYFINLKQVNKMVLEQLILRYRNCAYTYSFNEQQQVIEGVINFNKM